MIAIEVFGVTVQLDAVLKQLTTEAVCKCRCCVAILTRQRYYHLTFVSSILTDMEKDDDAFWSLPVSLASY